MIKAKCMQGLSIFRPVFSLALDMVCPSQAANDKLEVYRRTDAPSAAGLIYGDQGPDGELAKKDLCVAMERLRKSTCCCAHPPKVADAHPASHMCCHPHTALRLMDKRPDADKNEDEIRRELIQLRDVWHADQLELKKLHKVGQTECCMMRSG